MYLPFTLSQHEYVEASGYTCCYQALCPKRYISKDEFSVRVTKIQGYVSHLFMAYFSNFFEAMKCPCHQK